MRNNLDTSNLRVQADGISLAFMLCSQSDGVLNLVHVPLLKTSGHHC